VKCGQCEGIGHIDAPTIQLDDQGYLTDPENDLPGAVIKCKRDGRYSKWDMNKRCFALVPEPDFGPGPMANEGEGEDVKLKNIPERPMIDGSKILGDLNRYEEDVVFRQYVDALAAVVRVAVVECGMGHSDLTTGFQRAIVKSKEDRLL
jgi:hypothetical protein